MVLFLAVTIGFEDAKHMSNISVLVPHVKPEERYQIGGKNRAKTAQSIQDTGRATSSGWRTVALDSGKRHAMGRKDSKIYIVCDSSDQESLWIIFAADMTIKLKHELIFITGGDCITL
nr:probable pectate lyase 12 [Ipomoea batatas]